MPINEKNEVRMVGVLPSQGADPIPVRLVTEAAGADMIEKNEVRMVGVLPAQGADPIPVSGMLYPSPFSIHCSAFWPEADTTDCYNTNIYLRNRASLTVNYYLAPVILPHGCTVTKVTLLGDRIDALAVMRLRLYRSNMLGGSNLMSLIDADWITGWSSKSDDTIDNAVIDNSVYSYMFYLNLDPNATVNDVRFGGAIIEFTA